MDKIWYRNPSKSLAVVAGMKKPNDHAEPTKKSNAKTKEKNNNILTTHMLVFVSATQFDVLRCQGASI